MTLGLGCCSGTGTQIRVSIGSGYDHVKVRAASVSSTAGIFKIRREVVGDLRILFNYNPLPCSHLPTFHKKVMFKCFLSLRWKQRRSMLIHLNVLNEMSQLMYIHVK